MTKTSNQSGCTKLDVSILGAGTVVHEYYLPALAATRIAKRLTVVAPDAPDEGFFDGLASKTFVRREDFRDVLQLMPKAQAGAKGLIIVALPNHLHIEACELAMRLGHDVLCEKPLSLSQEKCRRVDAIAREAGSRLTIAMVRRWLPSFMLAHQMIKAGDLGQVLAAEVIDCEPFSWRPQSIEFFAPEAGGILADMGVHYLDFLDQLLGPMTPMSYSDDARGGNESSCTLELTAGDVPVRLTLSRTRPGQTRCRFIGQAGTLTIQKDDERSVVFEPLGQPVRRMQNESPFSDSSWPDGLRGSFCEMLAEHQRAAAGEESHAATAEDAGRVSGLIEWAYSSRDRRYRTEVRENEDISGKSVSGVVSEATNMVTPDTLITGGTGFIGGHLVERLARDSEQGGRNLRCLVRSPATVAKLARYPVELQPVDLLDRCALDRAMRGIRYVYHLAYGRDGQNADAVTIGGTKAVVEAAIAANVDAVVVLSTAYVFGFPEGSEAVDETFPYTPYGGKYGTSKAIMERWCLERAKSSPRTRIVILNPTNVFGPDGGAYTLLPISMAKAGSFFWFEQGRGLCNYTYVKNLVEAIIAAQYAEEAHGKRFIINDGVMRWADFLGPFVEAVTDNIPNYSRTELDDLRRHTPGFSIQALFRAIVESPDVRLIAKRSSLIERIASLPSLRQYIVPSDNKAPIWQAFRGCSKDSAHSQPPLWLAELYHDKLTKFSAAQAHRVLGWEPQISSKDAYSETLSWLRDNGHIGDRCTKH